MWTAHPTPTEQLTHHVMRPGGEGRHDVFNEIQLSAVNGVASVGAGMSDVNCDVMNERWQSDVSLSAERGSDPVGVMEPDMCDPGMSDVRRAHQVGAAEPQCPSQQRGVDARRRYINTEANVASTAEPSRPSRPLGVDANRSYPRGQRVAKLRDRLMSQMHGSDEHQSRSQSHYGASTSTVGPCVTG